MSAVHPEMTIWGVKGGSAPIFFGLNGRKERKRKKKKKNNAKFSGHYVRAHTLRSDQLGVRTDVFQAEAGTNLLFNRAGTDLLFSRRIDNST